MKVVINRCWGGFSVSEAVYEELGIKWDKYGYLVNKDFGIEGDDYDAFRADPSLVKAVEKVGLENSSGSMANLAIVDITEGIDWYIHNYDGQETVHEGHDSW